MWSEVVYGYMMRIPIYLLDFLKKFHYFILNYQGLLGLSDLDILPLDLFKSMFLFDLESLS